MTPDPHPDYFPYVFSEEADLPGYLRVRAEGHLLGESIRSARGYLRKYRRARWSACADEATSCGSATVGTTS